MRRWEAWPFWLGAWNPGLRRPSTSFRLRHPLRQGFGGQEGYGAQAGFLSGLGCVALSGQEGCCDGGFLVEADDAEADVPDALPSVVAEAVAMHAATAPFI